MPNEKKVHAKKNIHWLLYSRQSYLNKVRIWPFLNIPQQGNGTEACFQGRLAPLISLTPSMVCRDVSPIIAQVSRATLS